MEEAFVDRVEGVAVEPVSCVGLSAQVADVFDDSEVDGARAEIEAPAVCGEGIEESIGGGVVGLAHLADDTGDTGQKCEEVKTKSVFKSDIVEIPCTLYLAADAVLPILQCHRAEHFVLKSSA